jgi:predicted hotdog family 3-hydroxylacyl-ACP dehydratase
VSEVPQVPVIAELVPHGGAMCLLEEVLAWDDEHVVAATRTHLAPDHPLRRDGHLDPVHLCEYGAQAMAVHGGLLAQRRGERARPGLLVSLRDAWLAAGHVECCGSALEVTARRIHGDAGGWQYAFEVRHDGRLLARGRATVALLASP